MKSAKKKKVILTSTDGEADQIATDNPRYIKFAADMTKAGIPWRSYSGRGMYGEKCPAAVTSEEVSREGIIRATALTELNTDTMGYNLVVYP